MSAPDIAYTRPSIQHDDDAEAFGELSELASAWYLAGSWNEHATWTADMLREHVDNCCDADAARSNGPHDDRHD